MMVYNYTASEEYCKSLGLSWYPLWVMAFDAEAATLGMSQDQVDMCIRHHLTHIQHLFNPKIYKLKDRIVLSLHFLLGHGK